MLTTGRALEQYHGGAMSRRVTALVTAGVRLTGGITPGTVFMPFHFAEAAANLLNVQADTQMRESIAGASEEPPGTQRK